LAMEGRGKVMMSRESRARIWKKKEQCCVLVKARFSMLQYKLK
jgi:hypothetical protein